MNARLPSSHEILCGPRAAPATPLNVGSMDLLRTGETGTRTEGVVQLESA